MVNIPPHTLNLHRYRTSPAYILSTAPGWSDFNPAFICDFNFQKKTNRKNADHEEEKRQEKEKQEKAIGLLTYLGQGSVELQGGENHYYYYY